MRTLVIAVTLAIVPGAASSASAAPSWNFVITNPSLTLPENSAGIFRYLITNTSADDLGFSNLAVSANLLGFATTSQVIDPLLVVPAGQSLSGDLLQFTLLPSAVPGTNRTGTAFLTVQFADPDNSVDTIAQNFSVQAEATVPEPGSVLLVAASGGSLLALGRVIRDLRIRTERRAAGPEHP